MGTLRDKNLPVHSVVKGDSKIDGPYLDDINAARDAAYKNSKVGHRTVKRAKASKKSAAVAKKAAEAKEKK